MQFIPSSVAPSVPTSSAWRFDFVGRDLLVDDTPDAVELTPSTLPATASEVAPLHYLGTLDGIDCWAQSRLDVPAGLRPVPLRPAMMALDATLAAIAGRAAQILEWDRTSRFCGVCATPTELQPNERARRCPNCGFTAYPRISPAMMALVWRPGQVLLARAPHFAAGMYSALAGFVEAGESLEQCVHREVFEEVAVTIDDLRYVGSQSWPFPHSLMLAVTARWTGGEIVRQESEIADAQWFDVDALPAIPARFSIAGNLIRDTVAALVDGRLQGR